MKLKATITATITVKDTDSLADANERALEKLANICELWINGQAAPRVRLEYTIKDEMGTPPIIPKSEIN